MFKEHNKLANPPTPDPSHWKWLVCCIQPDQRYNISIPLSSWRFGKKRETECFNEFRTPMVILMNAAILSKFEQKRFLDNELQLSQSKFSITFSHWAGLFKLLWRWRSVLGMVLYIRDRWSWLFASFPWSAAVSVYRPINQFFLHKPSCTRLDSKGRVCDRKWDRAGYAMLMSPNKDETAVHGSHCRDDMAVRMPHRGVGSVCFSWYCGLLYLNPPPPPKEKRKEKREKTMHNHCFRFILGRLQYPGEIGNNGYAKFGGKQDALWSMWKWWIVTKEWKRM